MKTNRILKVKYKVLYDNDSELLTDKLLKIVQAHADWLKETPWENISGDGRVAISGIGVFEWKIKR